MRKSLESLLATPVKAAVCISGSSNCASIPRQERAYPDAREVALRESGLILNAPLCVWRAAMVLGREATEPISPSNPSATAADKPWCCSFRFEEARASSIAVVTAGSLKAWDTKRDYTEDSCSCDDQI